MYAQSTTSRKHITLTLAKTFQFKFAYFIMLPDESKIISKEKHRIQSTNIEIICKVLNLSSSQFCCYNELHLNSIIYKKGYYLTKFIDEMQLFKIIELIKTDENNDDIFTLVQPIILGIFEIHYEAFVVSDNEDFNNYFIFKANDFSGPPVNITMTAIEKKMLRLKEFY